MNRDICGIGRCKALPDMTCWSVPICQEHWNQCCKEMPNGSSLLWLRQKAKAEFRSSLPKDDSGLKVTPSEPLPKPRLKAAPVPVSAKNPPRRVVCKARPGRPVRVRQP